MVLSHLAAMMFWSGATAQPPLAEHQMHEGRRMSGSPHNIGGVEQLLGITAVVAVLEVAIAAARVVHGNRMNRPYAR
jgi:hypothetical protein